MEVGLNISTNLPCSMLEKVLMEVGEMYLGIGPALLPPTIQTIMLNNLVFIGMVIIEVDIGITPENFLHKNMAE